MHRRLCRQDGERELGSWVGNPNGMMLIRMPSHLAIENAVVEFSSGARDREKLIRVTDEEFWKFCCC